MHDVVVVQYSIIFLIFCPIIILTSYYSKYEYKVLATLASNKIFLKDCLIPSFLVDCKYNIIYGVGCHEYRIE